MKSSLKFVGTSFGFCVLVARMRYNWLYFSFNLNVLKQSKSNWSLVVLEPWAYLHRITSQSRVAHTAWIISLNPRLMLEQKISAIKLGNYDLRFYYALMIGERSESYDCMPNLTMQPPINWMRYYHRWHLIMRRAPFLKRNDNIWCDCCCG